MPSISIIVPIFNGLRYFQYFLNYLAAAIPQNTELIFVDDGSDEPVMEMIPHNYPSASIIKMKNDRNQGYSFTVNRGFAAATGDIIIQLNTDLVLDRKCITAMVDLIQSTPQVGIVGSKQLFPTTGVLRHVGMAFGKNNYRHIFTGMPADHPLCCKTRSVQILCGATVAMTKKVLQDIGPLEEGYYNTLEDLDHCMKAKAKGYINYACAESITYHWVSQSGPARFARVKEGRALFWSTWASSCSIDLNRFVNEALDHVLNQYPDLLEFNFEPLNLCRSSDLTILLESLEQRWKGIKTGTYNTRVFNSSAQKIWLPMELPYRAMMSPVPYIYLVDSFSELSENRMWFENRLRIVETEIVMDTSAVVMTTRELLSLNGDLPV